MQITIIKPDNQVVIDGEMFKVNCNGLPAKLIAVKWDGTNGVTYWKNQDNIPITSLAEFQFVIDKALELKAFEDARRLNPLHGMTVAQKRDFYRLQINAEYEARKAGGIQVSNVWYPSDLESMFGYLDWKDAARDMLATGSTQNTVLLIDDNPASLDSLDGTENEIAIKTCINLVDKARRLIRKLKRVRKNHMQAMLAMPDPEGYDFTTLWPERYTTI